VNLQPAVLDKVPERSLFPPALTKEVHRLREARPGGHEWRGKRGQSINALFVRGLASVDKGNERACID
jgi:hypothetical protein